MPINTEMFVRIEQVIEANPEQHWQKYFETTEEDREEWGEWQVVDVPQNACATTRCVAGWAVHLWGVDNGIEGELAEVTGQYAEIHNVYDDAAEVAQDILGLTPDQAGNLFYDFNNFSALQAVKAYARGEEPKPVEDGDDCTTTALKAGAFELLRRV